MMPREMTPMYL
jgi:hypothetical protein